MTWKAAGWAFRQLGFTDKMAEDSVPKGRYVVTRNIDAVCKEFQQKTVDMTSHFDRVFTRVQFQTAFASSLVAGCCLSEEDVEVLLTYLSRDKRLIDYNDDVIRIRDPSEGSKIGPEDIAVASIKELTANLRHQTDVLNDRIDSLNRDASVALGRKNRVAAQAALRSRKLAESSLAKRYASLSQLDAIAAKIQQASDQVQLVNVMKSSADALKSLNTRVGSRDTVDEVMDQIREQMLEVDEVAAILAESTGEPISEADIDLELAALEAEAHGKASSRTGDMEEEQETPNTEAIHAALANLPNPPVEDIPGHEPSETRAIEAQIASLDLDHR
jgi:charged multivesicular body protein 7